MFDVAIPATEIEVANAINDDEHNPVGVIRKLAFERDHLRLKLDGQARITALTAENERLKRDLEAETRRAEDWKGSYELAANTPEAELQRLIEHHKLMAADAEAHARRVNEFCGKQNATLREQVKLCRKALGATLMFREFMDEWFDPNNLEVVEFRELREAALAASQKAGSEP